MFATKICNLGFSKIKIYYFDFLLKISIQNDFVDRVICQETKGTCSSLTYIIYPKISRLLNTSDGRLSISPRREAQTAHNPAELKSMFYPRVVVVGADEKNVTTKRLAVYTS